MTSTCAQCSAFRHGQLWCGRFNRESHPFSPRCTNPRNGWDIEWKASGLRWVLLLGVTDMWSLELDGTHRGSVLRFTSGTWSAGLTAVGQITTGTLAECCRALVERVKHATDAGYGVRGETDG